MKAFGTMLKLRNIIVISSLITLFFPQIMYSSNNNERYSSIEDVQHEIKAMAKDMWGGLKEIRFTDTEFIRYYDDRGPHITPYKSMIEPTIKCGSLKCVVRFGEAENDVIAFNQQSSAKKFASALSYLMQHIGEPTKQEKTKSAADNPRELEVFKEKAKSWRYLEVKPPLPPEANRYWVLAEDAFQHKDFDKAIDYYEKGLKIYPTWPEGHFNVSLIYGEKERYAEAVDHMNRYLLLAPDAKDATAAREKIIIWEEKAKK